MIEYPIGHSGQTLVLSDSVLEHFVRNRQMRWYHKEAGGQVFASIEGYTIVIECVTGPRKTDRRCRSFYHPDRQAEQREIVDHFANGLHFVGDWHTHPEDAPSPSRLDRRTIKECFRKSRHFLNAFALIIVGRAGPPEGLYVALCDGETEHRLQSRDWEP